MTIHQSMSARAVQSRIDISAQEYGALIRDEAMTLEQAHAMLAWPTLDLFQVAGLAKAIACFQCSEVAA